MNLDDPFDGGEVNPVKKKNPKAGMSQRQECHQAILRNKVHPNCQGCLRLLGEIVLDWQKSGKGDQREKKNAGGNVGKTHDLLVHVIKRFLASDSFLNTFQCEKTFPEGKTYYSYNDVW